MAPRSLWNGTIAFGLVRVPVKLHTATESKSVSFRERHIADGAAIEHRRICVKEDREVPYSEIVKGFEVSSGSYVVLSKQEIAAAEGSEAHIVDIEHFVDAQEIDPAYYERSYYLSPGKLGDEPYCTLQAALERSGKVGIGRFVFHGKAHLAAVRAYEDLIVLHTMRFADEFVDPRELEIAQADKQPSKLEIDTAQLLVEQLVSSFEPQAYADTYRMAVLDLIERKAHGEEIQAPPSEEQTGEGELLNALRASLQEGHARKRRRPAGATRQPSGNGSGSADDGPRSPGAAARSSSSASRSSGGASNAPGGAARSPKPAARRPRRTRGEG